MASFASPIQSAVLTRMSMEADIETNVETGLDDVNQPLPPDWQATSTVRCEVWSKTRILVNDELKEALIEELRGIFPKDAAITEATRLGDIRDRYGDTRFMGPFEIRALQLKETHIEASLRRIDS